MKRTLCAFAAITALVLSTTSYAQDTDKKDDKKKHVLSISNRGITVETSEDSTKVTTGVHTDKTDKTDKETAGKFKATYAMFDLGVNMISDETNYTDPTVVNYLKVPGSMRNENLFDLKPSKSINVNIYPIMVKFMMLKTHNQRLYLSTGLGLQIYNFRYENDITYTKNPNSIILDTVQFSKNKLAVNYLNVPLMLTGKTRMHKNTWLVYGAGITAGYRMTSWNKQVSGPRGKTKTHGNFDLMDYNTCLTAEFGVEGILRFFGSYQLTSLYDNGINQRPIVVGIRLAGI